MVLPKIQYGWYIYEIIQDVNVYFTGGENWLTDQMYLICHFNSF